MSPEERAHAVLSTQGLGDLIHLPFSVYAALHEHIAAAITTAIDEALGPIIAAADAYKADPINAADRPSSWGKLSHLLDEIDRRRNAIKEGG